MKRSRPRAEDFAIGWVCALHIELTAAIAMLDDEYENENDTSNYTLGRIGKHNVVLGCLPAGRIGTTSAATVATEMRLKFPSIKIGLMVGIGGGVPSSQADIRLGDVVISQPSGNYGGVVQYDFGKITAGGLPTPTGSLNSPPEILLMAVSSFRARYNIARSNIPKYLLALEPYPIFNRDAAGPDVLYDSTYDHPGGTTCGKCRMDMAVQRAPRMSQEPVIHFGLIASGNQVIKDGATRDRLSSQLGGFLCFEMEAAGLVNSFPCLVIRGISDYADSHKNKSWQSYAAGTAAACAKEILSFVPTSRILTDKPRYTTCNNSSTPDVVVDASMLCAKKALTVEERKRCLEALKFDQLEARHATIKAPHLETCQWLLTKSEFKDWLNVEMLPEHCGFLWIKGKPGTGKSTIMKYAYTHMKKKRTQSIILSFFFNTRGEELEKSVSGMYRSLLAQLLERLPQLQDIFDTVLTEVPLHMTTYNWDIEILKTLFENALRKLDKSSLTCFIFIDALDECEEDQVREMIEFFKQLSWHYVKSQLQLYVCFASRHYPHITIKNGIELILEVQEEHSQDLKNYIDAELTSAKSRLTESIKADILQRASGVFLWVVLVVKILNKELDHGNIDTAREQLDKLPDGLHELFKKMISRDDENNPRLFLCLQWILLAKRPLTPKEFYFAILAGTKPESSFAWDPDKHTQGNIEKFILSSSKGFAELTKSKDARVQFIHESVREFILLRTRLDPQQNDHRNLFLGHSHDALKICCYNYMKNIDIEKFHPEGKPLPAADDEEYIELRKHVTRNFCFLDYAVHHVLYHSDAAQKCGFSQDLYIAEFDRDRKKWIFLHNILKQNNKYRYTTASLMYISAVENHANLIRLLAKSNIADANTKGEIFSYPLLAAIAYNNEKAVKELLMIPGIKYNSYEENIQAPLLWAVENGNEAITRLLLAQPDIQVNSKYSSGQTPLLYAVEKGYMVIIKLLLAQPNTQVNYSYNNGQTSLLYAAEHGHKAIVKLLLARPDIQVDFKDNYGRTPLSYAAGSYLVGSDHEAIVKLLLGRPDVQVDSKDNYGRTPLLYAARAYAVGFGCEAIIKLLLARPDIQVNSKDNYGRTPLLYAARSSHEAIVKLLLARPDIQADSKDNNGRTPLSYAAGSKYRAIVKLLLARPDIQADSKDNNGRTPLLYAAEYGCEAVIKLLLSRPDVQADSKDNNGRTPLSYAAEYGCEAIVKLLLARPDIQADSKDNNGRTPLLYAAEYGCEAVIKLLLSRPDVQADSKDNSGRTSLSYAAGSYFAESSHEAIVKLLLARPDVQVDSKDNDGQTPLSWAEKRGNYNIAAIMQGESIKMPVYHYEHDEQSCIRYMGSGY